LTIASPNFASILIRSKKRRVAKARNKREREVLNPMGGATNDECA
jgi:hypothetical protein